VFTATNLALGIARLFRWGLPSLRHGLAQRHSIIDNLLADSGCKQVLELAAGLSRRGAAMSRDPHLRYVEVDLPRVIDRKRKLLARSQPGRDVAGRSNLILVGGDVRDTDLASLLEPGPTFVIAEGLLMYLDAEQQRELWARIATLLADRPDSAFAFDLVPFCEQPKPGVVGRSLEFVFKRFTRGATFAFDDRTREQIADELRVCGFGSVELIEPADAPQRWEVPFAGERTQVLLFRCVV
jgi:O-methyltransferase involved in polyketide biosynthesis